MNLNKKGSISLKKNKDKKHTRVKKIKQKVVAVSGGFDPLHVGHVRMFKEARALGDKLVVILNNDHWLRSKKVHEFMSQDDRKEILESLGVVDQVIISSHQPGMDYNDPIVKSVCIELENLKPDVFANGGDRFGDNIPEFRLCKELGIEMIFGVGYGGKSRSSSEILKNYVKKATGIKALKKRISSKKRR